MVPQFLVTGMSSIIFAFVDPEKSAIHRGKAPNAPVPVPPVNGTIPATGIHEFFVRAEEAGGVSGGTIGLVFK